MSFLTRQSVIAALTANAVRPPRNQRAGVPSFAAGWLIGETAPQVLALTALDAAAHLTRGRRKGLRAKAGLALAGASALGLAHMIRQSTRVKDGLEDALVEGLGVDYVEQLDEVPTPADPATPWRRLARPFNFADADVRVIRDLPYSEAGRRGHLDIYLPAGEDAIEDAPVLLQVHGGAWTIGAKEHQGRPLMNHMAAKGWVCVAINYRLSPRDPWPAHIVDVKRAIAWIKENIADYGGDPDYLVITGGSAGGHLAALAALTPGDSRFQPGFEDADTRVQAAVPFYGVYDVAGSTGLSSAVAMRDGFLGPRVMQTTWDDAPDLYEAASPILRITPDAPDFFVIHGELDTLVSVDQARLFVAELRRTSRAAVVYAELPGAQHAFDVFHSIRSAHAVRAVDRYLSWHWSTWRRGLAADSGVDPDQLSDAG
ncbi:alpha/beta hydrolase [Nocardioides flavus (ex Wang et al. 2016)]|uniref:Alpha/beta hydrolase n=1 Tax=Nocardioides flavus (ex Wang et al. 2016) TaxID=2058780 RepID=A0ABQ3HMI7_9ACTN|nr:alpha/beta hydrolase [Nocardioides flavus (ex Wang et al. 2016)]GHE18878.1 alpha/beta hydrolase [Nocardioides flavus (ex Wang et al. 2016)]